MREEILRELFPSIWEAQHKEAESLKQPTETRKPTKEQTSASIEAVPSYHMEEGESLMTADEFARECDSAGIVLQIDIWLKTLDMAGGSEKARARLRRILDGDSRLKKELIRNAPIPKYHREKGESVAEYLRRNHANLFLAGILAEGVTDEREILKATRKGYKDMWDGSITVLCPEYRKYHNAPEIKRQREIIIAVLDGAFDD